MFCSIIIYGGGINNSVVTKLYKKEVLTNIYFHPGRNLMEDASWTSRVLERSYKVIRLDEGLYHYRTNPDSMVQSNFSPETFLEANFNRIEKLSILFRNIQGEYDEDKLSQDTCDILRMIIFNTTEEILDNSSLYQDILYLVRDNYSVLDRYVNNCTNRRMLSDIKYSKPPILVKKRLSRSLRIESILMKFKLL